MVCKDDVAFGGTSSSRGKIMMLKSTSEFGNVHKVYFVNLARHPIFTKACVTKS